MAAEAIGPRAVTSAQTEVAATGPRRGMSAPMGAVVIGLLVGVMFLRTAVEATGPEKVTSAPTGAVATGPLGDMSARTEAEGTGVLATKRGVAADYPSSESKFMKTTLILLSASLIAFALNLNAQIPPGIDPSQVVSGRVSCGHYEYKLKDGSTVEGRVLTNIDPKTGSGVIRTIPDHGESTTTLVSPGLSVTY